MARSRGEVSADPSSDVTAVRPNIGEVADFRSERWPLSNRNGGPTSNRNGGRLHVGMSGRIQSESAVNDQKVLCCVHGDAEYHHFITASKKKIVN